MKEYLKKLSFFNDNRGVSSLLALVAVLFAWLVVGGLAFFGDDVFDYVSAPKQMISTPTSVKEPIVNSTNTESDSSAAEIKIAVPTPTKPIIGTQKVPKKDKAPLEVKTEFESLSSVVEPTTVVVSAPEPLRMDFLEENKATSLTSAGVITWTNLNREENNLPPLVQNTLLDRAARLKLDDMFAKQYFAHDSPEGDGPAEVVKKAGYDFLSVGENLALGDFGNDKELVDGWMNSPGHRENILKSGFTQIGVAVGKNVFEGRETWMAVQEFGTPKSVCPHPDQELLALIKEQESELNIMNQEIQERKAEIDAMDPRGNQKVYNQKVDEFNSLIAVYNELVGKQKHNASVYNSEVAEFNTCLAKFK